MYSIKNLLILIFVFAGLVACSSQHAPSEANHQLTDAASAPDTKQPTATSIDSQLVDIDAITQEAHRVAAQVKDGSLNRTQAADVLNDFRLRRVGNNPIDDDTFLVYRRITIQRENGSLSQSDAQSAMESRLKYWRNRWVHMNIKPQNPAFTNFLLQIYNLPMLGK